MTAETTAETKVPGARSWLKIVGYGVLAGLASVLCLKGYAVVTGWAILLLYLAPLPLLHAGFALGLDSFLVGLLTGLAVCALANDMLTAATLAAGIFVPAAALVAMCDKRLRAIPDKAPGEEDRNRRVGIGIIIPSLVLGFGFVAAEFGLRSVGMRSVHDIFLGPLHVEKMTPTQLQMAQFSLSTLQFIPATIVVSLVVLVYLLIKLDVWLIRRIRKQDEPRIVFGKATLPLWYAMVASAAAIGGAVTGGQVGFAMANLAVILALPAMMVGLGLVNTVIAHLPYRWLLGVLIYAALIMMMSLGSPYVIALVGFLDSPLRLREWIVARMGVKKERRHA